MAGKGHKGLQSPTERLRISLTGQSTIGRNAMKLISKQIKTAVAVSLHPLIEVANSTSIIHLSEFTFKAFLSFFIKKLLKFFCLLVVAEYSKIRLVA